MPEVAIALVELKATGSVIIIGESGTGKSLAAAHAAYMLLEEGAEVVELTDQVVDQSELRQSLLGLPRPVVAILDDAQRLPPAVRRELLACGGHGLFVIAVLSGVPGGELGIRLDAGRATASMAAFIRANRDAALPIVHALDSHVGDGPLDEPLERRLEQAQTAAKSPWELAHILAGGWRRIHGDVSELRAAGGYDLILGLNAIVQLLRLGGSASIADVRSVAEVTGQDDAWFQTALAETVGRRLLIREGSTMRLPHLRFAQVVLELILAGESRDMLLEAVRGAIDERGDELIGIHWLLDVLFFADPRPAPKRSQLPVDTVARLVARCWAVSDNERGAAAFILNDVRRLQLEAVDPRRNRGLLGAWISEAAPSEMPGLSRLVNDTYNTDRELLGPICRSIDAAALARRFGSCSWPQP